MSFIINPYLYASAFSGLLDTYGSATVAYSLRRLSSSYSGSLIRVREDSGNTETDIGYDSNGDLDTAAIASHCGANNGFVVTWYDQSGNSNDATQSVAGEQPQIYNGSTTITDPNNGNVAMDFDGTADTLDLGSAINTTQLFFHIFVFNRASAAIRSIGLADNSSQPNAYHWASNDGIYTGMGVSSVLHDATQTGTGDFIATSLRDSSDNVKIWRNGSADTTKTYADNSTSLSTIGRRAAQYHDGHMQELIYWNSDQESNQSGIETDLNTYWGVF